MLLITLCFAAPHLPQVPLPLPGPLPARGEDCRAELCVSASHLLR
jgi:hypothetical protein